MRTLRRNRTAFQPSLIEVRLEDRAVPSGGAGTPAHVAPMAAAANSSTRAPETATQTLQTRRDLLQAYHAQFLQAENGLKQLITYEIDTLYSSGKPSAHDLASLQGLVSGVVDGTAFRVSSQLALPPGATDTLVARAQQTMVGSDKTRLANRLDSSIGSARVNQSAQTLMAVINRTIANYTQLTNRQFVEYLVTNPIDRPNNFRSGGFKNRFFGLTPVRNQSFGSDPPSFTGLGSAAGATRLGTGTTAGLGFTGTGLGSTGTGLGSTGTGLGSTGTGLGFTGTGLGFTGTGLDFTGAGLGFTGTGLGFTGTGLGFTGTEFGL